MLKGICTGVNFVFYEGIEVIRVYDCPIFEEDSKKCLSVLKNGCMHILNIYFSKRWVYVIKPVWQFTV